jgi:hypothetical protein
MPFALASERSRGDPACRILATGSPHGCGAHAGGERTHIAGARRGPQARRTTGTGLPARPRTGIRRERCAVAVFDVATRRELGRVATGGGPEGVYVCGDGRIAYVSLVDAKQLVAIDVRARQVVCTLPLDGAPERMACFPAAPLLP